MSPYFILIQRFSFLFLPFYAAGFMFPTGLATAREWKDSTGGYSVAGSMIAFDQNEIIIKLDKKTKGRELLAFPIANLSNEDRAYVESQEAQTEMNRIDVPQNWTLKSGIKVVGKVVNFARRDVTIQRRRGKIYVNDRQFENLPEVYQKMVPRIVAHFEKTQFEKESDFQNWMKQLKLESRTYTCDGVLMELASGDEYGIPFFFFSDADLQVLQPGWESWIAKYDDDKQKSEEQRQKTLYLQSQAIAYQQSQQESQQVARLQLQLQAVNAGVVSAWEVYLDPARPNLYPLTVVVTARNSEDASIIALKNNPGYVTGPVRKLSY